MKILKEIAEKIRDNIFILDLNNINPTESKPYPNEHACRLKDPNRYDGWGQLKRKHNNKEYKVIRGKLKDKDRNDKNAWEDQSFRYKKNIWTASAARSHCKDHNGTFEAAI